MSVRQAAFADCYVLLGLSRLERINTKLRLFQRTDYKYLKIFSFVIMVE